MEEELANQLKTNRPNISNSTVKTYISILRTIYKKLDGKDGIKFFENEKRKIIDDILKIENNQTIKTKLSALFVLTGDDDYHKPMLEFANKVNANYKEQKTDKKRAENLPTIDELKQIYDNAKTALLKNKSIDNFITYFVVALTSGVIMPPRRSLDYCEMKIRNFNKTEDNYIDKDNFIFNKFKTSKFVKQEDKIVKIPTEILKFIKQFKKISDNDYLLYNVKTDRPYNASTFSKLLNRIFGKNISVDALRSIYLTNLYGGLPPIKQLEQTAQEMGHSVSSALNYYVKQN